MGWSHLQLVDTLGLFVVLVGGHVRQCIRVRVLTQFRAGKEGKEEGFVVVWFVSLDWLIIGDLWDCP